MSVVARYSLLCLLCLLLGSLLLTPCKRSRFASNDRVIPLGVHVIFGMTSDFGGKPFGLIHYLSIKSACIHLRVPKINLHYVHEPFGYWWDQIQPFIRHHKIRPITHVHGHALVHPAHQADVARLQILIAHGGIYMDSDVIILNPFPESWFHHDFVIAQEGPSAQEGLGNAVLLSKPQAPFAIEWLQAYSHFNDSAWAAFSIKLPKQLWLANPERVHVLNAQRFFDPLWTEQGLDQAYSRESKFEFGRGDQVAWHAWSQMAWDRHLHNLTVESIQKQDTPFKRAVAHLLPRA